jgi:hypothetical protein
MEFANPIPEAIRDLLTRKPRSPESLSVDELVSRMLVSKHPSTVRALVEATRSKWASVSDEEIVTAVKRLHDKGVLELKRVIPHSCSFQGFLAHAQWSLDFWFVTAFVFLALFAIHLLPVEYPIVLGRWILGTVFVAYVPGHSLVQVLFPGADELDRVERLVYSLGLSVVLVMVVAILLNWSPYGIRLEPMTISLAAFTMVLAVTGAYRQYLTLHAGGTESRIASS